MKTHTEYLWFETRKRKELVRITGDLEAILERSGVTDGMMLLSAMHITSGIIVNDDEPGLHREMCIRDRSMSMTSRIKMGNGSGYWWVRQGWGRNRSTSWDPPG